jgi:hypothetical protein
MGMEDSVDRASGSGEVTPVRKRPGWMAAAGYATVGLMLTGSCMFIGGPCRIGRTYGATRSARLQWEQRRCQVEEVIAHEPLGDPHSQGRPAQKGD